MSEDKTLQGHDGVSVGGYGYGYTEGDGEGYFGVGVLIRLGGHPLRAVILPDWGVVLIGCEAHTLAFWEKYWRYVAIRHGVVISDESAQDILEKVKEAIKDFKQ